MSTKRKKNIGLSTADALKKLHDDIEQVLKSYENKKFKSKSSNNILSKYSIFITLLLILGLFVVYYYLTAILVLLILILNAAFVLREEKLRNTELIRKTYEHLKDINLAITLSKDWKSINYPHLCSPLSPCITLCWTYRDNELRNLPTSLLVEGDVIVMRLGATSPGICHEFKPSKNVKPKYFKLGDTYGLATHNNEPPTKPIAVAPLPDILCVMDATPYLDNLKLSIEKSLDRPQTIHNKQRHYLINRYIQQYTFAMTLVLIIATIIMRAFDFYYIKGKVAHSSWTGVGILNCVSALMPLLPLIFPIIWINLHHWGTARLETLLAIPQPLIQVERSKNSPEIETPTSGELNLPVIPRRQVFYNYIRILNGSCDLLSRSTQIIQVLGTVTAFCCVDKKGILSWPNPTPEKVFFLRDATDSNSKSSECSLDSDNSEQHAKVGVVAEVLDLTHDQNSPFKLEFDDHEWKNHINSLKPLGLSILVNTCCEKTQFSYSKFCGHITATSLVDKNLVPVTNRYDDTLNESFVPGRCLCELARQIGFTPQAKSIFHMEGQISSYRHLQPEVIRRDIRFTKSLHLASKIKVPFPHALSVVVRETYGDGGTLQLLTQGTADIILDCCDDFWSGKDLRPLKEEERKRAQDFYQRNALTAYCTAFAYRPLRHGITGMLAGPKTDDVMDSTNIAYLELPPESFEAMRHAEKNFCNFEGHSLCHSISSDSLLFTDLRDEEPVNDVDGCFEMQCHQIFIGMVTMQYQAQTDIVQLIERFERACIRFVHFSKENELRSRVFSEKMGLESGWNCHISLLATEDNNSSVSSPKQSKQLDQKPVLRFESESDKKTEDIETQEYSRLLPHPNFESTKGLSTSAPCAISNPHQSPVNAQENASAVNSQQDSRNGSITSNDSALEGLPNDDNNQSLSLLTESSEQSAQIPIYMSNRAKLPRGIKNIEPHIENVDNVPLLVSLFTDCSPEATKEMLRIMQRHGEVVVVMGSSASSNANCQIFLQADCSIGCEPLYPQVCQNFPAYTESNIYNNKQLYLKDQPKKWFETPKSVTISPVYLSRMLNSIACSITMCRDDPISILGLIELARRFSIGLWNCVQFWSCSAVMFTVLNLLSCCISLPPILTPDFSLYLMCFVVAPLAISLVRVEPENIMNRAYGRKSNAKFDVTTILFILWCYGTKFIAAIIILIISYSFTVDHVFDLVDAENENFQLDLKMARNFILFGTVLYLVIISSSFVHRDYSLWKKNPFSNRCWLITCIVILSLHLLLFTCQMAFNDYNFHAMDKKWPVLLILVLSTGFIISIAELCKYYEIKNNLRATRRARLDFTTKLGMNSPF